MGLAMGCFMVGISICKRKMQTCMIIANGLANWDAHVGEDHGQADPLSHYAITLAQMSVMSC